LCGLNAWEILARIPTSLVPFSHEIETFFPALLDSRTVKFNSDDFLLATGSKRTGIFENLDRVPDFAQP